MKIKPGSVKNAAKVQKSYLPKFGKYPNYDVNLQSGSTSKLGFYYQLPSGYTFGSDKAKNLLAGSSEFVIDEIEVFYGRVDGK